MAANGYKLLGYVVWQVGKWYLRRKLPPARTIAGTTLAAGSLLLAAILIVRRFSN